MTLSICTNYAYSGNDLGFMIILEEQLAEVKTTTDLNRVKRKLIAYMKLIDGMQSSQPLPTKFEILSFSKKKWITSFPPQLSYEIVIKEL